MRSIFQYALVLAVFLLSIATTAQNENNTTLQQLAKDNWEEVEALSLYPDDVREAILESTLHPELLVKLSAVQRKTKESFQEVLEGLPEEEQKKLWELTKYNGLMHKLVEGGAKSKEETNLLLKDYPQEIHQTALECLVMYPQQMEKIDGMSREADRAIGTILQAYPDNTQQAIRKLLKTPEVVHLLTDNLELAVLVGDYYAKDPQLVIAKADSIKAEVARRYAGEINAWESGLAENPRAREEFEQVSKEFSDEKYENYDDMYPQATAPKAPSTDKDVAKAQETTVVYEYYYYPYWFGYPYWYPDSYWYWYPYWYHWGYYYYTPDVIIVTGLPSYYFIHWYFTVPSHHYRYPHFSDYIIRHYERSARTSRSGINAAVRDWERSSSSTVTRELLDNDVRRVERLKEYGVFEEKYQRQVEKSTRERTVTRDEYLKENSRRYPNLNGEERNTIRYRTEPQQKTIQERKPQTRTEELNRARDLHQRTWERSDYSQPRTNQGRSTTVSPTAKPRTPTKTQSTRKRDN